MPRKTSSRPAEMPDPEMEESGVTAGGTSTPDESIMGAAEAGATASTDTAPTDEPPEGVGDVGATVAATWRDDRVLSLWSINEPRNAWARLEGVGYRKIYNGREAAFLALCSLASLARQTGRPIRWREESDAMIHEIYLW